MVQETWYNKDIDSNEITAATNFTLVRNDRSMSSNTRKNGGGLAILIKQEILYEVIPTEKTLIEIQTVRLKLGSKGIILINTYIPPYRARLSMVKELHDILIEIKIAYQNEEIVMCGDFNMSHIKWIYHEDAAGYLIPQNNEKSKFEKLFVTAIAATNLHQINNIPNSKGTFLDLIFVSNYGDAMAYRPSNIELIDDENTTHYATALQLNYIAESSE